jgi:hypothetical protein
MLMVVGCDMTKTWYLAGIGFAIAIQVFLFSGVFGPSNYWECLLDEMPGVKNDRVASAVMMICRKEHPGGVEVKKIGNGTVSQCIAKYGKDVQGDRAVKAISYACNRLYR